MCRVRRWQFDAALFPDLSRATILTALRIEDFCLTFPEARVID